MLKDVTDCFDWRPCLSRSRSKVPDSAEAEPGAEVFLAPPPVWRLTSDPLGRLSGAVLIVRLQSSTITSSSCWLFSFQRTVVFGRSPFSKLALPKNTPAPTSLIQGRHRALEAGRPQALSANLLLRRDSWFHDTETCRAPQCIRSISLVNPGNPRFRRNALLSGFRHASRPDLPFVGRAKVARFFPESSPDEDLFSTGQKYPSCQCNQPTKSGCERHRKRMAIPVSSRPRSPIRSA